MSDSTREDALFPRLTDEQLACVKRFGQEVRLDAGDVLFQEGDPEKDFYVILEGDLKITKNVAGEQVPLTVHHAGEFTGALSMFTGSASISTARALTRCRLIHVTVNGFKELMTACPAVAVLLLTTMAQRRPDAAQLIQQREKLAALGKMSAGLAHELNNPAAAGGRAAGQLRETFDGLLPLSLGLGELCLTSDRRESLVAFQREILDGLPDRMPLEPLARSDAEDAVTDWLDSHGVADGWEIAPTLVEAGLDADRLDALADHAGPEALPAVLTWLAKSLSAACLLREIEDSTARIADLVKAIKSYSYMDQAPQQEVDLHEGLESTLTILNHKLKHGIEVVREYDRSLPRVPAYGSELNQVWTNLIDNAVDAMGGQGRITIRTAREDDRALVEIADAGPGIPPDLQDRLFEPFFTTKGVGKGTGLGLDTSRKIVVDRHHGNIQVTSEPGDTRFQVYLPLCTTEEK